MDTDPKLKWLFLDLNSFFASVEQNEAPHLRGKPVAVVPSNTEHTCAIAASYEAKAYGVKTGTIISDAKQMCPNLICVPARHDIYVQYHNRILEEFIKHAPINKVWSIDELSSRLPPSKRNVKGASQIARNLKNGLWNNIGPAINCSIGVAPNALLAKIAGNMQKPDGLTFLDKDDLPGPLLNLKLTDLTGIGENMKKRLNRASIITMQDLWDTSPKQARKIWGSVQGERFWYWLHGYDFEAPETKDKCMIGHSRVLDPQMRTPEAARQMARRLLTKATYRLRRGEYFAQTLSLGVRTSNYGGPEQKWRREIRLPNPAQDPFTFLEHLETLWTMMLIDLNASNRHNFKLKKVSTLLMNLHHVEHITGDMMTERYKEKLNTLKKRESLATALDTLQTKYKHETVTLGRPPKTLSGYVGTKIAFSRVPDTEEFWH
ncbi:MAG: impB/mucB/samB family protein [Bdellovibrionales bacterium]